MLGEVLDSAGISGTQVTVTGSASVGAVRSTLFIDVTTGAGETIAAVAQLADATVDSSPALEGKLLAMAGNAGVPVPTVMAAVDNAPLGNAVLISERVPGESIPRRILRAVDTHGRGEALAEQCGQTMAQLHAVAVGNLPRSLTALNAHDPYTDYVDALAADLDDLPTQHPAIRLGLNYLRRHPPSPPNELRLVHGDFRNGNILVADGQLTAVLDWELAHIGDPMEDLAWMCVRMWRFGNDHLACGGFGTLAALRRGYEQANGHWRDDAFTWWLAARSAWWAIGLAKQAAAYQRGESDSIVHVASGRRVPEMEFDLLTLIRQLPGLRSRQQART